MTEAGDLGIGELDMPKGKTWFDPFEEMDRQVFEGDTVLVVPVTASTQAPAGGHDIAVAVRWQGCTSRKCYMPGTQTFNVPVRVKEAR